MKKCHFISQLLIVVILSSAAFIGCADQTTSYTSKSELTATVAKYFPLNQGACVEYVITNNWNHTTSRQRFTVGTPISINGRDNFPWMSQNVLYPQIRDTGYFYIADSSLYYFDSRSASAERVLEAPFTVGNSWQRSTPVVGTNGQNNLLDILTGNGGIKNDNGGGGVQGGNDSGFGGAGKCFPTTGADYFIVAAVENIKFADGNEYKNCIRIENRSGDYANYYWYAPGAGLVRYAINSTVQTYPGGEIVGEIAAPSIFY
jgi:hypothetical protein